MTQRILHTSYLVLTFPSLNSLTTILKHEYLPHMIDSSKSVLENSTCSTGEDVRLIIVIRFNEKGSIWSDDSLEKGSEQASSSSTLTTKRFGESIINNHNDLCWNSLQTFLSTAYSTCTNVFVKKAKILANVEIVIEEIRRLPICLPSITPSEEGDRSVKKIDLTCRSTSSTFEPTTTNSETGSIEGEEEEEDRKRLKLYPVVALGGTFDHLHPGHKILLTMAAALTKTKLIVGVTDEQLLKTKKHAQYLEPLSRRIEKVVDFLEWIRPGVQHHVVPIQDPYGPTATEADIQAIVVSEETRSGGQAVNKKRSENGFDELEIWSIDLIADADDDDGRNQESEQELNGLSNSRSDKDEGVPVQGQREMEKVEEEDGKEMTGSNADSKMKQKKKVVGVEFKMGSTAIREWLSKN